MKQVLAEALAKHTNLSLEVITRAIERPKKREHGDLAFPCFALAKVWQISPNECAKKLGTELVLPANFDRATAVGPFLNFSFERKHFAQGIFADIPAAKICSPRSETIIVEYSSPNIAKPFHVGHLRATLIGNSLDRVYRACGYNVVSINHLGDWGTQFGFVWAGCKLWGTPENATVTDLVELYRRATSLKEEQEKEIKQPNPPNRELTTVNELARKYFLDLEAGAEYAVDFWKWCVDISMRYFRRTYERIDANFDHYTGESFYSDKLEGVKLQLEKSGILQTSQGALGVDLGEELGFARVLTPDGRSLYLTRDIAAAEYRFQTFKFSRALYVVGAPQSLHFRQLKGVLRALGHNYAENIIHVEFGHVLGMRTRGEGEFIELNEFFDEAYERSLHAYREQVMKRPEGLDEHSVATAVARAAIIFSTLNRTRSKDVHFDWNHALAFQGDSGPYLLYAYARINGIKEKANAAGISLQKSIDPAQLTDDHAYHLLALVGDYDEVIERTISDNEPNHLASYALELARGVSQSYMELKVVGAEKTLGEARLALFEAVRITLGKSLRLLGIEPVERM